MSVRKAPPIKLKCVPRATFENAVDHLAAQSIEAMLTAPVTASLRKRRVLPL